MPPETRRALIVVRTYPTPAQQGIEVSCTAAITPAGEFRDKCEAHMIQDCDTHFYVGTVHRNPRSWIIVGLFYPPKLALTLFD
jgi:hypothetical protein